MEDDLCERIARELDKRNFYLEDPREVAAPAIMAIIREERVKVLRAAEDIARREAAIHDRRLDELSADLHRNPTDKSTMQAKMVVAGMSVVANGIADVIGALIRKHETKETM